MSSPRPKALNVVLPFARGAFTVLVLTLLHWLLLSFVAWRALYQLVVAPYAWETTEHGLPRTSRLNAGMTRSLIELERYLTDLENAGLAAGDRGRRHRYFRRSAAASAGCRLRLKGATKRPCLSIR